MTIEINVDKVPDADVISQRIFSVITLGEIERELISKILSDWNNEWIDIIAEERTGRSEGDENTNSKRLKDRMNKLGVVDTGRSFRDLRLRQDDPGF